MIQLGIIPKDFTKVGVALPYPMACSANLDPTKCVVCDCPQRLPPPGKSDCLPFEACPENLPKMKEWVTKRYINSTFNKCPHKPLPAMAGPPVKFHIDPNAVPICLSKPAQVPLRLAEASSGGIKQRRGFRSLRKCALWSANRVVFLDGGNKDKGWQPQKDRSLTPLEILCKRGPLFSITIPTSKIY